VNLIHHLLFVGWSRGGQGRFLFLLSNLSLLLLDLGAVERRPIVHFGDSLAAVQIISIITAQINIWMNNNELSQGFLGAVLGLIFGLVIEVLLLNRLLLDGLLRVTPHLGP
jgi:hypothetical protein